MEINIKLDEQGNMHIETTEDMTRAVTVGILEFAKVRIMTEQPPVVEESVPEVKE